jgi:hypothetical protein
VTLKRTTGLLVNVDHNAIRITWQIHPDIHVDLRHFFIDFGLRVWERGE